MAHAPSKNISHTDNFSFFTQPLRKYSTPIMATEIFAVVLLVIGIIVIYISRHNDQPWQRLARYYTLPWAYPMKATSSDRKEALSTTLRPFQLPPLKPRTSSRMAMGLKRLDESNWLTIDTFYPTEHTLRAHMLQESRPNVLQCLPGTGAACHEGWCSPSHLFFIRDCFGNCEMCFTSSKMPTLP